MRVRRYAPARTHARTHARTREGAMQRRGTHSCAHKKSQAPSVVNVLVWLTCARARTRRGRRYLDGRPGQRSPRCMSARGDGQVFKLLTWVFSIRAVLLVASTISILIRTATRDSRFRLRCVSGREGGIAGELRLSAEPLGEQRKREGGRRDNCIAGIFFRTTPSAGQCAVAAPQRVPQNPFVSRPCTTGCSPENI